MSDPIVAQMRACKIIPVLAIETVDAGLKVCQILNDAGLKAAEVTFRTQAAEGIIRKVAAELPEMFLGAGTVLNPADVKRAYDAGAKFAVAPGCNPTVVNAAKEIGLPFYPGIASPSDLERAYELGCKAMKFFPAEAMGGTKVLKSIIAPYRHLGIQIMPTGGVNLGNLNDYLSIPEVMACGGTWLAKGDDVKAENWDQIRKNAEEAVAALK